jgi:hypothetical protein
MLSVYTATPTNARTATTSRGDDAAAQSGFRVLPAKITSSCAPAYRRAPGSRQKPKPGSLKKWRGPAHGNRRQPSELRKLSPPTGSTKQAADWRSQPRTKARLSFNPSQKYLRMRMRIHASCNMPKKLLSLYSQRVARRRKLCNRKESLDFPAAQNLRKTVGLAWLAFCDCFYEEQSNRCHISL